MRRENRIAVDKCELKPCPFCGGHVRIGANYLGQYNVLCADCGVMVWLGAYDAKTAHKKWNRRSNIKEAHHD